MILILCRLVVTLCVSLYFDPSFRTTQLFFKPFLLRFYCKCFHICSNKKNEIYIACNQSRVYLLVLCSLSQIAFFYYVIFGTLLCYHSNLSLYLASLLHDLACTARRLLIIIYIITIVIILILLSKKGS